MNELDIYQNIGYNFGKSQITRTCWVSNGQDYKKEIYEKKASSYKVNNNLCLVSFILYLKVLWKYSEWLIFTTAPFICSNWTPVNLPRESGLFGEVWLLN